MVTTLPLIWYKTYWLHQLYCKGLDASARRYIEEQEQKQIFPVLASQFMRNVEEQARLFYWIPLVEPYSHGLDFGSWEVRGYQLFAKEEETDNAEFSPILKILKTENDSPRRLYSCKEFEKGDVITLVSTFEENTGKLVFGGTCARFGDSTAESNAYLCLSGALRCTKPIAKGEEVVRASLDNDRDDFLERIDRVIISPEDMCVGRIASEPVKQKFIVDYTDGRKEVATVDSGVAYSYRDKRDGID
mmetsp:Transcript_2789/g.6553  ORF Transcript_2789/g.6553 Transcript_2789/m.6553 type:complete len:246 (+) Transcript_2789:57-794(+)